MNFSWSIFVDLGLIALALLSATYLHAKVGFFQKYLIPNALSAGFILLPFYNFLAPLLGMSSEGMGNLVFHLLNLSFIAMSLRDGSMKGSGKRIFASSVLIVSQYTIQSILGLGLTALFIVTMMPKLFLSFGFLLPLGFALGPGQAYAIGKGWEAFGFEGGGSLGLVFAALGYVWACIGGVYLINLGIRRGWLDSRSLGMINKRAIRTGIYGENEERPVGSNLTTETEAIDTMSYNLAIILGIYLLAYLFLRGLTYLLSFAGPPGQQLAVNLWGISFIFAAIIALLAKKVFKLLKINYTIDGGSLNRIAGTSVDIMVTAAIAAITIPIVTRYWMPIVVVSTIGGLVITVTVFWTTSRLFGDHQFSRAIMFYGNMTGTLSTGLALLRVIDPDFETPVANDYMFASGITFVLCIPLILMLNLPVYWHLTGNPLFLWLTIAGFSCYLLFSLIAYTILAGKKSFKSFLHIWVKD